MDQKEMDEARLKAAVENYDPRPRRARRRRVERTPFLEVDDRGYARLVVDGERSEWHAYEQPIIFKGWLGLSAYWNDKETVRQVGDPLEPKVEFVCRECGKENGWNGESYGPQVCEHLRKRYPDLPVRS